MKKTSLILITLFLTVLIGITTGCDNRSQLEKDADKAAAKVQGAFK